MLIIFTAIFFSCAARPVVREEIVHHVEIAAVTKITEITEITEKVKVAEEQVRLFDLALIEFKNNSPVIQKYIEPREAVVNGTGFESIEDIIVKGEFNIGWEKFEAVYNIPASFQDENGFFHIPFSMEDSSKDILHEDLLLWRPSTENSGILLSFDDNYWDLWYRYFDLFDFYNAKITFFVQGSIPPNSNGNMGISADETKMSLTEFCFNALKRGHSLGYHTINHPDLRNVSAEVFFRETIEAAEAFFLEGIFFSGFAYPYGFSRPWMHEELSPVFFVTRGYGTNIRLYNTEIDNDGFIVSKAIDNTIYRDNAKFENDIHKILLAAKFTGNHIVPFTTHEISDEAQWGIEIKRLEYLLKTAEELKMRFYTYDDFFDLFPLSRQY